jgi:hypothetical protein
MNNSPLPNGKLPTSFSWPSFWGGFAEGIVLAFYAIVVFTLVAIVIAWQTVLPSIGVLWLMGAL